MRTRKTPHTSIPKLVASTPEMAASGNDNTYIYSKDIYKMTAALTFRN